MKINKFINTGFSATKTFLMPTIKMLPLLSLCIIFIHMISEMGGLENIKYDFSPTVDLSYKINGDVHNNKYKSFFNSLLLDKGLLLNIGFTRKELNVNVGLHETTERGEHYSSRKDYIQLYLRDFENSNPIYEEGEKNSFQVGLFKIFKSNDKVLSYIFFHEFAHKFDVVNGVSKNQVNVLLSQMNREEVESSKYFTDTVKTQSSESFADAFAIKMMSLRYRDVSFEQTKKLVAGLRNYEHIHGNTKIGYDIGYGLILNKNNPISKKEEIINYAKEVAMGNINFEYLRLKEKIRSELIEPNYSQEQVTNTFNEMKTYKRDFSSLVTNYEQKLKGDKISIKISP